MLLQLWRQQGKTPRHMRNQSKMTPPKDHNNLPLTEPVDMEIYNLPEKEFKIYALRKFNELQGNTERQYMESGKPSINKMRKLKRDSNNNFLKYHTEILEPKNTMNETNKQNQ